MSAQPSVVRARDVTAWYTATAMWYSVLGFSQRHIFMHAEGGERVGAHSICQELAKRGTLLCVWGQDRYALPRGMSAGQVAAIIVLQGES